MSTITIILSWFIGFYLMPFQNEKELNTEIKEVTVFMNGAQVFETGTIQIPAGESILKITNRSPYLDDKSIQVKGTGDFTIVAVNPKSNFLESKIISQNDSLFSILSKERLLLENLNAEAEVLREKASVLNTNKNLGGQNNGINMTQLKQAADFFEKELMEIKQREISNKQKSSQSKSLIDRLEQQLNEFQNKTFTPVSEIYIKVNAEKSVDASFSLSYLVENAGWFPKYDIRVNDIQKPLQLTYKAEVWQNTGNDWKNVKLRFSNGEPSRSGVMPELRKWELTYARNIVFDPMASFAPVGSVSGVVMDSHDNTPLPGATVMIKGTTIGTTTDVNGRYSITIPNNSNRLIFNFIGMVSQERPITGPTMNIFMEPDAQALSEVVVTGYSTEGILQGRAHGIMTRQAPRSKTAEAQVIATMIKENQTTIEIEVEKPYSILSNGEKLLVDLKKHDLEAQYEYYAVPKLEKEAFLVAKITGWEKYSFLQGEANLYFEDTFIGKSILEAESFQDTLSISLGRDRGIAINREKIDQFSRKRFVGNNVDEARAFRITVKNNKSQKINLTLIDQVPVSIVNDISVSIRELSKAKRDEQTGILTWKLELAPAAQEIVELQYEVRYPRKERVILD
ncbi:mucoidy inhibitor MuiA family protein [Aquiflexum sp.]|uniref:mucoidy inhibitor MuiA family protein n=1 Tax=Aquiflexum sp. TaxID=1872584 RepID=UPI003593214D